MPLGPGSRLDAYELLQPLGAGGMGEVWLATEVRLGRKVALKLLPAELTRDRARVSRFEQEARAASGLSHPNVCTILALGETAEGQHYIAMEFVEGETLRRRIATGRPTLRESLDIAIQIASALVAAHANGIVHRDIKPENVMLRPDGLVKVLDFGLAKLTAATDSAAVEATHTAFRTDVGTVVGTVAYMSPEQARGQQVDARTDMWSLGVVLYEMVAGRSPFVASSSSDTLAAILDREPPPVARFEPDVPAELQRILTKTLRKDRAQRYQTSRDLLLDLQALRDQPHVAQPRGAVHEPDATRPPARVAAPSSDLGRVSSSRRPLAILTLLAVVAALLFVGWWWGARTPSPPSSHVAVHRNLSRLTFGPGLQTDVTWSPDGTRIAYAADTDGNFDIWVQPVDGGEATQLTTSTAHDTQPAWSPDGHTIVFRSERDTGGLYLVPAGGGPERHLTSFGAHPQWTADGARILFRGGGIDVAQASLHDVSAAGGEAPRALLPSFLAGGYWLWVGSHPDGRISVLGSHPELGSGFYTVAADAGHVTRSELAPHLPLSIAEGLRSGHGTRVVRFQWSAAGNALYVEAFVNEVRNIWRVIVDPKTLRWLAAERLTAGGGADVGAAVSRDGRRIAFTTERHVSRLWVFPFDASTGGLTGQGKPVTPEEGEVQISDLSPDGTRVAYLWIQAGTTRRDLWVSHIDSGRRELLAQGVVATRWSPAGDTIAYTLFRLDPGEWALALRTPPGPERLLSPWSSKAALLPMDWTPDRSAILGTYFAPIDAEARLALWPASHRSSTPQRILMSRPATNLWQGRYSPNGRWLAFAVGRPESPGDDLELIVAPAGGAPESQWVRVAADHGWADKPRWGPDGKTLYFISRHGGAFFNLWGVRFDAARGQPDGEPFMITRFESPALMISPKLGDTEIGISAERALLTLAAVTGNIWMLDDVDK
jgi:eukaryotic-like serine/threonine-protein kinase